MHTKKSATKTKKKTRTEDDKEKKTQQNKVDNKGKNEKN